MNNDRKKEASAAYVVSQLPEGQTFLKWLDTHTDQTHLKKGTEGMYDPIAMAVRVGKRELYLDIKRKIDDGERARKA